MEKIFLLPDLGEGLAEAIVREWFVKEGDVVTIDQTLAAMETDKALVEIPSPYQGKILQIYATVDEYIKTDAPFIKFEIDSDEEYQEKAETVVGVIETDTSHTSIIQEFKNATDYDRLTPEAWKILNNNQISYESLYEYLPQIDIITAADVQIIIDKLGLDKRENKKQVIGTGFNSVRQAMFHKIVNASENIAPVTIFEDANISHWPKQSDFTVRIIQAIANAISEVPIINSHYDHHTHMIDTVTEVNCGIAMDSEHGLFMPVLHDVAHQTADQLRQKINEYKLSIKNKQLKKDAMINPTIALSNFGVFGAKYATPMVIPPMVCIIGLGQSHKQVIVNEENDMVIANILPISVTVDHKIITGGEATRFLSALIKHLQAPS